MRLRPAFLAAVLALSAGRSFALEPAAPPSPVDPDVPANYSMRQDAEDAGGNIFIGHFGETVRLPHFWAADAKMQGPMERVNFHFKTVDPLKLFSAPFSPSPKDYVPENFARLRLMQMLVIPKDVPGGFRSLGALREAKAKELSATGNPYDLRAVGEYPWPPDTFWVSISTPYPLFQLYTQSDKNILIVTSGASPYDIDRKDPLLANSASSLCNSLSTYVYKFVRPAADKPSIFDLGISALPWAVACAISLALGFLPRRGIWLSRLRLMGRMTAAFATAGLLIGGPLLFVSHSRELGRVINEASILFFAGLIMPWICRAASARLNGRHPWRVFAWSAAANILPIVIGLEMIGPYFSGASSLSGAKDFWMLGCTLSGTALLNGVAFGLAHRERDS